MKKLIMCVLALALMLCFTACENTDNGNEANEESLSKEIEITEELTEEEQEALDSLEAEYAEKIANANSNEEKEALKNEFASKAQTATSNKASTATTSSSSTPSTSSGTSSNSSSASSGSASKPSTSTSSSTSTNSSNSSGGSSGSSTSSTPPATTTQAHVHTVSGNTGMWFNTVDEADAYYLAEITKLGNQHERGEITDEEYDNNSFGWEGKQCTCGMWTVSFKYYNPATGQLDRY